MRLRVCMCACEQDCVHFMCRYVHGHAHVYMRARACVYVNVCMRVCVSVCVHVYACLRVSLHGSLRAFCVCVHVCA